MAGEYIPKNSSVMLAAIGLNQQMLPVFLGLLFAATIAWIFLSSRLYTELRQNNPRLYEKLGKPKFFMKKSFTTNVRVIRFLLKRDYEATDDNLVIRLCQGLRSLFFIYIICLAGCLILLFDKMV
jgi:hypothetical protein